MAYCIMGKPEFREMPTPYRWSDAIHLVVDNGLRKESGGFFKTIELAKAAWERHENGMKALAKERGKPLYITWQEVPVPQGGW